jgi:hypothetical protein
MLLLVAIRAVEIAAEAGDHRQGEAAGVRREVFVSGSAVLFMNEIVIPWG